MASNLDYLDPALLPLEEKVQAYLEAEEELRKATVDSVSASALPDSGQEGGGFEQRPATGSFDQVGDTLRLKQDDLHARILQLQQEILQLLPARDEWVKVNLGYGPSRVGAFREDAAGAEGSYVIRVVH
ncbi:hypothetical protein F0P96_02590 [Hymenobacter busanensis]|uniref:Uncharacterized protein n=1 Tax=Hymenobacter busanensis TaxID=2607656 RepID=A0A7L4ZZ23_9BACT|nr:hypothetical protein [Hymenobacter busanensis]KAA9339525.1 hypothetical protein F0P96_02590 [Hymenobacter busanensis]QHJ06720.1 hypothetical protein GUY19_05165 [Hymenobacter busanensis]